MNSIIFIARMSMPNKFVNHSSKVDIPISVGYEGYKLIQSRIRNKFHYVIKFGLRFVYEYIGSYNFHILCLYQLFICKQ